MSATLPFNWRLLGQLILRWRRPLGLTGAVMTLEGLLTLALPAVAGLLAQRILADAERTGLLLGLLALLALQAAARYLSGWVSADASATIQSELRQELYDHVQALPIGYHQTARRGEVLAVTTWEVWQLAGFLSGTVAALGPQLLTAAGAAVLMLRADLRLGLAVLFMVPVVIVALRLLSRRLRPLSDEYQRADEALFTTIQENLELLPVIKMFSREALESARVARRIGELQQLAMRRQALHGLLEPVTQLIIASGAIVLLHLAAPGGDQVRQSAAEWVSFLLYAALLVRPLSAMASTYGQLVMAGAVLARVQACLREPGEAVASGAGRDPALRGEIEFSGVGFAYPGREPVLSDFDLRVEAGETVAITGHNGAGKSTLVHLLLRLYEPAAGVIRIDGADIRQIGLRQLRSSIGIVPQHVLLQNASVLDNIRYGVPEASDAAVRDAAILAQAHEFIERLPLGYQTTIGDQGVRLSGGQRQRVALARALLRQPPILVLDEATAMFDPAGEAAFIEAFRARGLRSTVLIITHRPASLALAGRVVEIKAR